jgi:hypothetical protein
VKVFLGVKKIEQKEDYRQFMPCLKSNLREKKGCSAFPETHEREAGRGDQCLFYCQISLINVKIIPKRNSDDKYFFIPYGYSQDIGVYSGEKFL